MIKLILSYFILILLISCNSTNSDKEMELKERELKLRERELSNQNSTNYNTNDESSSNGYNSSNSQRNSVKSEEDLRKDLLAFEANHPKNYLNIDYDLTFKVFSGEDKITGTIFNSATMAAFKDVVLVVSFSSATDAPLGKKEYIIYDYVYPDSSVPFTIKTYSPNGTKKIGVKIKSALND